MSLISLFLPAGGAILTIRNLQRLGQIESEQAKQLTLAAYVVFSLGFTALLLSSHGVRESLYQREQGAGTVLSFGVAIASYMAQRTPYREWKLAHEAVHPSPWLGAAGRAIVYALLTVFTVLPLCVAATLLGIGGATLP